MWNQTYVELGYLLKVSLIYHRAYLANGPQRPLSVTLSADVRPAVPTGETPVKARKERVSYCGEKPGMGFKCEAMGIAMIQI